MKIHFPGAGARGCPIGGTLAAAGSDVALIDRFPTDVEAINRDHQSIKDGEADRVGRVKAAKDCLSA